MYIDMHYQAIIIEHAFIQMTLGRHKAVIGYEFLTESGKCILPHLLHIILYMY